MKMQMKLICIDHSMLHSDRYKYMDIEYITHFYSTLLNEILGKFTPVALFCIYSQYDIAHKSSAYKMDNYFGWSHFLYLCIQPVYIN